MTQLIKFKSNFDQAFNLAAEEHFVRNFDLDKEYIFIYQNDSSVIIGKNQNIFEEINFELAASMNIPVFRRISGGGAVYHDPGNINFAFFTRFEQRKFNNYAVFMAPVIEALNDIGVPAEFNERYDIVAGGKKISGNAQFTSRNRMMSHGTLLFDSDLDLLNRILKPDLGEIESRATKSVRSSVSNVTEFTGKEFSLETFIDIITNSFRREFGDLGVYIVNDDEMELIEKLAGEKYRSREWIYERSPSSRMQMPVSSQNGENKLTIFLEKGRIEKIGAESQALKNYIIKLEKKYSGKVLNFDTYKVINEYLTASGEI